MLQKQQFCFEGKNCICQNSNRILGRGTKDEAYYCYKGQDYLTRDFSWLVTDNNTHLVQTKASPIPPENAIKVISSLDVKNPDCYFVVARTKDGLIPGTSNGIEAFYAYGGKEHSTTEFHWIVVENIGEFVNSRSYLQYSCEDQTIFEEIQITRLLYVICVQMKQTVMVGL